MMAGSSNQKSLQVVLYAPILHVNTARGSRRPFVLIVGIADCVFDSPTYHAMAKTSSTAMSFFDQVNSSNTANLVEQAAMLHSACEDCFWRRNVAVGWAVLGQPVEAGKTL